MKISKFRLICLIVIGLYILTSICLGISAYRYHTSEHPPLMAVGYDDLFWVNTQIHVVVFLIVIVCGKLYRILQKWTDK